MFGGRVGLKQETYEYAREGKKIDIESKKITINKFDLKRICIPQIDFEVNCSKGTYISG